MQKQPEVEAWLKAYDNPMKSVVMRVRDVVLDADPRMSECIKWKAPTFVYDGNLASFQPRSKRHASLLFHTGATIPGSFPHLEGGGDTARYMRFEDDAAVDALEKELRAIVRAWCDARDAT